MPDDRLTDRVSADMERIFRGQGLPPADPVARARSGRSRDFVLHARDTGRSSPSARRRLMRMLTIAVPLLTIAVAAFLFLQIGSDIRPVAARPVATVAQARPAAVPSPVAATASRPDPVAYRAIAPVAPPPAAMAAADVAPAVTAETPAAPPPARRSHVPSDASAPPRAMAARDCVPGSEENRCIYAEVRDADRRLVAAYRAAAEAGVPRREMVAIRRVWTQALADSLDDPDGTIRVYDDLARRLRDAARTVRAEDDLT